MLAEGAPDEGVGGLGGIIRTGGRSKARVSRRVLRTCFFGEP